LKCTDAKPLILLRRRIAVNADLSPEAITEVVKAIDDIRRDHANSKNCDCWTNAVAELRAA
jgi:hypothetical protein